MQNNKHDEKGGMNMKRKWLWVLGLSMVLVLLFGMSALAEDYVLRNGGSSKASAVSVSYNQLYAGQVNDSYHPWYKFTTPATSGYMWLYMKNNSISSTTYFEVYTAIEERLSSDGCSSGYNYNRSLRLNPGTIFISPCSILLCCFRMLRKMLFIS